MFLCYLYSYMILFNHMRSLNQEVSYMYRIFLLKQRPCEARDEATDLSLRLYSRLAGASSPPPTSVTTFGFLFPQAERER